MYIIRIVIYKVVNVWLFWVRIYFKEVIFVFVIGYEYNVKKKVKLKVLLNKIVIWYLNWIYKIWYCMLILKEEKR